MPIGKTVKCADVPAEYLKYAQEDEKVARMLFVESRHRHCVYFALQAMEKYLRARIFRLVNPYDRNVIDSQRNHDVEAAIADLVRAIKDPLLKEQVRAQLNQYCPKDGQFPHLHNNARYPYYQFSSNAYVRLDIVYADSEEALRKLDYIKQFLVGIDMYIEQEKARYKKTAPPRRS